MELQGLLEKLDHLQAQPDAVCEQAAAQELDYKTFLTEALQLEWQGRFQRGYNDAAYFNREYKSVFGNPPMRDVQQLRKANDDVLVP